MKRLLYLFAMGLGLTASAQSFSLRNVNDEYVVTNLAVSGIPQKAWHEIIRDENGLYWFQSLTDLYSFDGANWKSYTIKSAKGENALIRFNDLEVTDDNTVWVATEGSVYILDRASGDFIPMQQAFPDIKSFPRQVGCFFEGSNTAIIFRPVAQDGFFLVDWKSKKVKHIRIDSTEKIAIPSFGFPVETDHSGNIWGITIEKKGIWQYNITTGQMKRSWKNELPQFADKRAQHIKGLAYDESDNVLWLSYPRMVEKVYLTDGHSQFYSFSADLKVQADSNAKNKLPVTYVKIDRNNSKWVVAGKYIVKLNSDITRMEYLVNDPNTFPVGTWEWFKPVTSVGKTRSQEKNILLWVYDNKKISIIKKRNQFVKQIPFDTLSKHGIMPEDYVNTNGRKSIFFEKGRNGNYFLRQKNQGRPKLICFDDRLKIDKVLFNEELKQYPAYFSNVFNPDVFYLAMMRPGIEPLDFRNVIAKDIKVDLTTFMIEEMKLDFRQRVWRYGSADINNTYWLFSNGYLFAYNPAKDLLDSIFICKPAEKRPYIIDGEGPIKGFDYPTVLHRNSSTYWICFTPTKELYKINLKTKKIEKIFKCCVDQEDCDIPGLVFGLSDFDSSNICLKVNFSSILINAKNDSLTRFSDLFKNMPSEVQKGSGRYKDWIYAIRESGVYFLNTRSGEQKRVALNEDYTWEPLSLTSIPIVNERGEMILMSSVKKGFLLFNVDSVAAVEEPGVVNFSFIKLNSKTLLIDSLLNAGLILKYNNYRNIHFGFSDYTVHGQDKIFYEYTLYKGGDTIWNKIEGKPELTLSELSAGKYQLLLRAGNGNGGYSRQITAFPIVVIPPFTQTVWFILLLVAAVTTFLYGLYRYRLHQIKRLQIIRNNIASDLHDDIGSTLNSISIYSEVAKQQAGKEIPALDLIGINSRKIIESMSDIVWTINPENDSFEKIIIRMRSFAHQLLKAKKVEYTFEADETLNKIVLPMQVRKNFYLVFKEAITNVIKYSEARRVSILLYEKDKVIMLRIRDNGKGIPVNAETKGNGLMNMSRRASEINAELNIISQEGGGTEIELMLDNIK